MGVVDNDDALTGAATSKRRLTSFSIAPAYQVTAHFLACASRVATTRATSNDFTNKSGTPKKNQGELLAESVFSF